MDKDIQEEPPTFAERIAVNGLVDFTAEERMQLIRHKRARGLTEEQANEVLKAQDAADLARGLKPKAEADAKTEQDEAGAKADADAKAAAKAKAKEAPKAKGKAKG